MGEAYADRTGSSVVGGRDIDGDGTDDLVIGAPDADFGGEESGRVYVVFGKTDTAHVRLEEVANGGGGFAIDGVSENDRAGLSVGVIDDMTDDGRDEIIVGTGAENVAAYVVFGKAESATPTALDDVESVGEGYGLMASTADQASSVVSSIGDIDGDGREDFAVTALLTDPPGSSGSVYVLYGANDIGDMELGLLSDLADGERGFCISGEAAENAPGLTIGGAGDFNADGLNDLLIGAPGAGSRGIAYVFFGVPSQLM